MYWYLSAIFKTNTWVAVFVALVPKVSLKLLNSCTFPLSQYPKSKNPKIEHLIHCPLTYSLYTRICNNLREIVSKNCFFPSSDQCTKPVRSSQFYTWRTDCNTWKRNILFVGWFNIFIKRSGVPTVYSNTKLIIGDDSKNDEHCPPQKRFDTLLCYHFGIV